MQSGALPKPISPMLSKVAKTPFDRKGWIFEIKWDGVRAITYKNRKVKILSRKDQLYNTRFPSIASELKKLPGSFIVDGEIVALDEKGKSNFQLLQNFLKNKQGVVYAYYLFDILEYKGKDLTQLSLLKRKEILAGLLKKTRRDRVRLSEHINEKGKAFFRAAKKIGLEGIMAKRADSPYQFSRSSDWLKIKTIKRQETVIGGFTAPKGGRSHFGALLLGVYEGGKLVFVGHVGTGFTEQLLSEIYAKLKKIVVQRSPFATTPAANAPVTWVKPELVCDVSFYEWTQDGIMRQPVFKGLRDDKPPKEVVREF
ncbi:MAG: non-homologous end-joining DNA ligase [Chlamydiales bacterium]